MNIEKIFDYARENNISDIHLLEGEKIYLRKDGEILEYDNNIIVSKDELLEICNGKIEEDFAYTDSKSQRYRVNSFLTLEDIIVVSFTKLFKYFLIKIWNVTYLSLNY